MKKIVILLLVFLGLVETCRAGKRVALVIGNADYSIANGRLSNPVNDAIGVAEELEKLGYRVDLQTDLEDREAMEIVVERFAEASAGAEISLFYYSGHGVQYDGKNYLMPTRASINNARQIRHRAMNVGFVLDEISAGGGLHLVILDACRDNPYPRDSKSGGGKGMARMDAPSSTIIAYATKPDATAADGDGNHSPYTRQLLNHLRIEPNQPIDEVLNRINVAVEDDTDRQQSPRLEMSPLRARYCFGLCGQLGHPATKTTHALTVKTSPADATVRILNIAPKYRDGIELKPGRYHLEATAPGFRRHTEWIELGAEDSVHSVVLTPLARTPVEVFSEPWVIVEKEDNYFIKSGYDHEIALGDLSDIPKIEEIKEYKNVMLIIYHKETLGTAMIEVANAVVYDPRTKKVLADLPYRYSSGSEGLEDEDIDQPIWKFEETSIIVEEKSSGISEVIALETETALDTDIDMVWIKPGCFRMGSPAGEAGRDEDESQHRVCLSQGYYLGKYEVTQRQWQAVMGNNPAQNQMFGLDYPVENVSWDDVQSFIDKLNQRTGLHYRLPTEAEWEFAARAGSQTAFAFGNFVTRDQAKFRKPYASLAEEVADYGTAEVGSFLPNAWKLYDMQGNVWEWTQDWYGEYQNGTVTDSKGLATGSYRVVRGGSWKDAANHVRSANRESGSPSYRSDALGFRLARSR